MGNKWQLQEAKSKFSELVKKAMDLGPQFVTKRGENSVVVLSLDDYKKLQKPKNSLVNFFKKAPKVNLETTRNNSKDRELLL